MFGSFQHKSTPTEISHYGTELQSQQPKGMNNNGATILPNVGKFLPLDKR